jgi:Mce-associated membrane protein
MLTHSSAQEEAPSAVPASWPARAAAFLVDFCAPLLVVTSSVLIAWSAPQRSWLWWVCVVVGAAVVLAAGANRWLLPVLTGWTLGRAVMGIAVVRSDATPPGPWCLLVRDLLHVIDTVPLLLGWLWPLWDRRGRTLADIAVRTEARRASAPPPGARRVATAVVSVFALVAVVVAALGYLTVYRPELRVAQAREQLAVQAPKLVTDMLSYSAATLQEDFARGRSVVTEGYLPRLVDQQKGIEARGAVDNDYWSPNAAVLEADENRGTVLVLLQGQRGVAPNHRTISATVKARLVRVEGQWRIDDLVVVAAPQVPEGGR